MVEQSDEVEKPKDTTFHILVDLKPEFEAGNAFDPKIPSKMVTATILQFIGTKYDVYPLMQELCHQSRAYCVKQHYILKGALLEGFFKHLSKEARTVVLDLQKERLAGKMTVGDTTVHYAY